MQTKIVKLDACEQTEPNLMSDGPGPHPEPTFATHCQTVPPIAKGPKQTLISGSPLLNGQTVTLQVASTTIKSSFEFCATL